MPFVNSVFSYSSVAFIGMDKNCGKTETMNYFLQKASSYDKIIAVTSIGIDGELKDQVTLTPKPEITLECGNLFLTCEVFYNKRRLMSEILDISTETTALGRLITARVLERGKVMLAGPSDTFTLKKHISKLKELGADLVVVDGALSRVSIASPTVTDSLVLSTGAVVSHKIDDIVKKSAYQIELICLPICENSFVKEMNDADRGIYSVTDLGLENTGIDSVFMIKNNVDKLFSKSKRLFFSGVLNDDVMEFIIIQSFVNDIEIIVRDFTKIFVTNKVLNLFLRRGGKLSVLNRSNLLAVCINPVSPLGYTLSSEELSFKLAEKTGQKVYDIKRL